MAERTFHFGGEILRDPQGCWGLDFQLPISRPLPLSHSLSLSLCPYKAINVSSLPGRHKSRQEPYNLQL